MLFSEVYSCYFNAVAEILEEAVQNTLTERKMTEIIRRKAFAESSMVIQEALKEEKWPLLTKDKRTPLHHVPTMPLTIVQKRWMKSLLLDPRIHLFAPDPSGLEDVKPLYEPDMFVYYDRYHDGDPYDDDKYRQHFKCMLEALKTKQGVTVEFLGRWGKSQRVTGVPVNLEYSAKDDKFRVKLLPVKNTYGGFTEINMSRIVSCQMAQVSLQDCNQETEREKRQVILELTDERDVLRRAMFHFSYLEKETVQLEDHKYRITIFYEKNDETEIVIQILSFGPLVQVVGPESFREELKRRVNKQWERCNL